MAFPEAHTSGDVASWLLGLKVLSHIVNSHKAIPHVLKTSAQVPLRCLKRPTVAQMGCHTSGARSFKATRYADVLFVEAAIKMEGSLSVTPLPMYYAYQSQKQLLARRN